jgi:hypothetical protein
LLARQTDGAAVELPPEPAVIPALWRAKLSFIGSTVYNGKNAENFKENHPFVLLN